jgi:hypothetical protein
MELRNFIQCGWICDRIVEAYQRTARRKNGNNNDLDGDDDDDDDKKWG